MIIFPRPNKYDMNPIVSLNKLSLVILLIFLLPLEAISQGNGTAEDQIFSKLIRYLKNHPLENAYLQFSQPFYASGDTLYFKAYVTEGEHHKLSEHSGVLHVDLINSENKIDQSIKLKLDSGVAFGDFALPDSLPNGNYRIRAYTQWMRNDSENDFFERVIPVGTVKPAKVPESMVRPALNLKPDIQFLPESGSLIDGINTKIAFKAIGPNGLGMDLEGEVFDNNNKEVATFASAHLGMGEFAFTPTKGTTYSAKITYANGVQDVVALPNAKTAGIALSVNNDSLPMAVVTLTANDIFYRQNKGKAYTLLIYSGGLIITVACQLDSAMIKLDILKRKLHTGVTTVTLFSPQNEPLCERLFFVQNYDNLDLNISANKISFQTREKVNIKLNVLNRKGEPAEGNFSTAVVNENTVKQTDQYTGDILSHFLLTSELKGHVEQPTYYFVDTTIALRRKLDLLMMTHGYRCFEWKQVLDTAKYNSEFQPEMGVTISGRVDNLSGRPTPHGTIRLVPTKGGQVLSVITNEKGIFHFPPLSFTDTAKFILSAVNTKGKDLTKISRFDDRLSRPLVAQSQAKPDIHVSETTMRQYLEADSLRRGYFGYDHRKNIMLKEVIVKDKKIEPIKIDPVYGFADQTIRGDEIEYGGSLAVRLMGKLHGVHFNQSGNRFVPVSNIGGRILIVVDGSEMPDDFDISSINTGSIESIELMNNATVATPDHGAVLVIHTTHGLQAKDMIATGILPITVIGFYKARQFYSPKYDTPVALANKLKDLRSTIYWHPEIKTDKNGNASFYFYNSDGAGIYKVTIEGIDKDGNIGRQVYRYEVK